MVRSFKALNNLRVQGAIAGGIGGAVGFVLAEIALGGQLDTALVDTAAMYRLDAIFGALTGVCIGLALGAAEGLVAGARARLARGAAVGACAGLLGGIAGILLGETIYQPLKALCFVGRAIGWSAFGAVIGMAEGLTRRSWRGLRSAMIGGAVGGAIGGFMFDLVGTIVALASGSGTASRAIALIILGACIGLFIVIMERALADGWLKVLTGRSEGRDFFLDKPRLTVGRDERCDVALFGDSQVQPQHALLVQAPGGYAVESVANAALLIGGTLVQGQQMLQHGDILTVGATKLLYRLRKGGPVMRPARAVQGGPAPGSLPVSMPPAQAAHTTPPRSPVSPTSAAVNPHPPVVRTCPYCGNMIRSEARFCGTCGRSVDR